MKARLVAVLLALAAPPLALASVALVQASVAHAQDTSASTPVSTTSVAVEQGDLASYYRALSERRLVARELGTIEELRTLVRRGEELTVEERWDEASLVLFEAVESPRFADFAESEEHQDAEFMLAGALHELGALRTAFRYLERIVARGVDGPYFGPAYRRAVDVALAGASIEASLAALEQAADGSTLPPDAQNELRYLRGRARYDARELGDADHELAQITRRSRFYANAQYLRGAIAVQQGDLDDAETLFCSIATTSDTDRFTFYVDRRYFEIRDLTWLALGRVAHEGLRAEDAFYYYFQVPNDSERVAEALFEAAWAMYEGNDHETAIDLLDQLQTRFPASPFVDEAALLRGYVHLSRCEFEEANDQFVHFAERFEPLRDEVDRILTSDVREARVVEELLAIEAAPPARIPAEGEVVPEPSLREMLLGLLRVDPSFYRLYAEIRALDAEAARSARLADQLGATLARVRGVDAPEAAVGEDGSPASELARLELDVANARSALRALTDQLDEMRRAGAPADRVAPIEETLRALGERVTQLERGARDAARASASYERTASTSGDLETILEADRRAAATLPARVADVRGRMLDAAGAAATRSLTELRDRLASELRRARIGRIDAVMGSKRRIEIQIESLSAGRFPPELLDPLHIQGLLRDDEEYWPFEGEYWEDEYEEDEEAEDLEPSSAEDTSLDPEIEGAEDDTADDLEDDTAPPDDGAVE